MQNQNVHPWSWGQGSAPSFPGGQPGLPAAFPPPRVDQTPLLPGYPQIYGNSPAQPPTDYGQWTAAQLQQWQQWQQWQEKYQQWQAQYGKKYEESLAAMGQNPSLLMPGFPSVLGVPKPVEPASTTSLANPPLPANSQPVVPPPPPDEEKPPLPASGKGGNEVSKNGCQSRQDNPEELSEAEKTFDIQFKQWEGQFNEWKKQNQDHPDKAQYREYEKKWETWREQLLHRREQMRIKRLNKAGDQPSETSNSGKSDDSKGKQTNPGSGAPPAQPKSLDSDYSYKSQPIPGPQGPFNTEPPKFDTKPPFFEKPPMNQNVPPPSNFGPRGNSNQDKNMPNLNTPYPNNFGSFPGSQDKMDPGRQGPFLNNQNFNRNQGPFGNQGGNFEGGQGPNSRFGNFEGGMNEGNFNSRFRNQNFGGNFDGFQQRQRFGNNDDRNFGPPQRFDNFRNERDFGQQRFFDNREMGPQNFGKGNFEVTGNEMGDFRQGPGGCYQDMKQNPPLKSKVPSLFDITVEKPPGLMGPNNDKKPKIWEKYEKDDYYDDPFEEKPDEREPERNDKPWGGNNSWPKNMTSPWIQPWEIEKMASQKPPEGRPWNRDGPGGVKNDNIAWMKDIPGKPELDKAELSGYVGNILAKLGNFKVMPPNLSKDMPQDGSLPMSSGDKIGGNDGNMDPEKKNNWNDGFSQRNKNETDQNFPSNQNNENFRNQNRCGPIQGNFGPGKDRFEHNIGGPGARDLDDRGKDFGDRSRDGPFPPRNFDRFPPNSEESALPPRGDMDERTRFEGDPKNLDIDERVSGRDDRRRDDRNLFGRDDLRNFTRPTSRDDRRNFGEDRFFNRDDNRPFGRSARDDRGFSRFGVWDDIDERINRNGRRGFDRFDKDDRDGRGFFDRQGGGRGMDGPFDRFGRGRNQPLNEPVWNPQVFDYSQGRPQRLHDSDDGFKISTVVDYSHGENKQTFDYDHGEASKDRIEMKSFDYGHKADAPTVIDYGHGVDKDSGPKDWKKDRLGDSEQGSDDRIRTDSGTNSPIRRRSRSPRGRLRSRSRSPHSRFKRGSISPPYKGHRSRSKDRLGRQIFKRDRNCSEDKLSPGDDVSRHSFDVTTVLVEDLICLPGRESRPSKLVFIMRGIPGSGKTYVTKLIKDKEVELGGDPPRILSLDDYFMTEVEKEVFDKEKGRKVKTKVLEYEYEAGVEPHYRGSLLKAFKKTVSDGFFSFIIVDSVNEKTKDYEEMWSFAKQKGFQVYIAEMDNDVTVCTGRNIHKRTEKEISELAKAWEETPPHYLRLDVRSLLQSDAITEVEMEVVSDTELEKTVGTDDVNEEEKEKDKKDEEEQKEEEEDEPGVSTFVKSRWDQFENSEQNLDRLDGLKRRREGFHATMEDYLQLPDDFDQVTQESVPGKKRVRWADLEERRQQEKMRAIGFVVGQTDWSRMTDPTFGESALTRTKYI